MRYLFLPLALMLCAFSSFSSAEEIIPWKYNSVNQETLPTWRFLAVSEEVSPLPTIEKTRIGVVDLPWQLERTRPKGFYMTTVQVPERFSNREVLLEVETVGLTRVYFNGVLAKESMQAARNRLRIAVSKSGAVDVAVSVSHRDAKTPARFNKARLVAVPKGYRGFIERQNRLLGAFPQFAVDAAGGEWKVMVRGPKEAYSPTFDDSGWETADKSYSWRGTYTPCWWRGYVTVPSKINGIPTEGRQLNIRARFDDKGTLYADGKALDVAPSPERTTAFSLPKNYAPGDRIFVAIDLLNNWGGGGLDALEFRFAELDVAELNLEKYRSEFIGINRILQMHDQPQATWLDSLHSGLDAFEKALNKTETIPVSAETLLKSLKTTRALMDKSPILLLEPYLQDVRSNQVTVMWESSAPVASQVEYRRVGKRRWKTLEVPFAENAIQEAIISKLKPDTTYDYRVRSGDYAGGAYRFHTAPDTERAFSFIVWGDNRSDPDMCEKVSLEMDKEKAEFVLNVGDVVGKGSRWHEWTEHYLIPVRHWSHKWPSYVAIGNHEYGGLHGGTEVPGFEQYLAHPTIEPNSTEYWYSFDYANTHFLFIDGNRFTEDHSSLDENEWSILPDDPQLAWIKADLEKAQKTAKWILVFIHAPPYSEGWSGEFYNGEPPIRNSLVPILERSGVDIVFAGHTHDYERGLPHAPFDPETGAGNNAAYIISGGGGASLDDHKYYEWDKIDIPDHPAVPDSNEPDEGEYYKYHYITVEIDGNKLDLKAKEVLPDGRNAGVFDRFKLEK